MAFSRSVSRLCSRIQSLSPKFNAKSFVSDSPPFIKSTSKPKISSSSRRTTSLPVELSALITMMPLHSAIASSCLKSGLLLESQSWGLVPQAIKFKCLPVTNDEMRDHLFQLLGNDFFPKWKERHQMRFHFSNMGSVYHMPPPCSVVIQEVKKAIGIYQLHHNTILKRGGKMDGLGNGSSLPPNIA